MKREKKLTKKERRAAEGKGPSGGRAAGGAGGDQHIHCVSCGRHIEPTEFDAPATATILTCAHRSQFAACVGCQIPGQKLLDDHDKSGQPVKAASAWH